MSILVLFNFHPLQHCPQSPLVPPDRSSPPHSLPERRLNIMLTDPVRIWTPLNPRHQLILCLDLRRFYFIALLVSLTMDEVQQAIDMRLPRLLVQGQHFLEIGS